jgi:ATP-dependent 26S proteasome regulatory subunit
MRPPTAHLRAKLWQSCIPSTAPIAPDVDYEKLGQRFDFSNEVISNAVFRAAASAALRPQDERIINMKDLMSAAEVEKKKNNSSTAHDLRDRLFC